MGTGGFRFFAVLTWIGFAISLSLLLSVEAVASNDLELVESVAQTSRQEFYRSGKRNVSTSRPERVNENQFHLHLKDSDFHAEPLGVTKSEQVLNCITDSNCTVWFFIVSGEQWSKAMDQAVFVLIHKSPLSIAGVEEVDRTLSVGAAAGSDSAASPHVEVIRHFMYVE